MRCPHCAGECPEDAAFCGICGQRIAARVSHSSPHASASAPGRSGGDASMSLFELPVSRGARFARIAAVTALNLVLAGSGIAMIASYFRDRAALLERFEQGGASNSAGEGRAPTVDVRSPVVDGDIDVDGERSDAATPSNGANAARAGKGTEAAEEPRARARRRTSGDRGSAREPRAPAPAAKPTTGSSAPPASGSSAADRTLGTDPRDHEVAAEESSEDQIRKVSARVGRVVDRHRVQLQKCYQQAAKTEAPGAPLSGRLEVRFTIMPDGTASDVSVPVNTSGSDRLADCVSTSLAGWALPDPGDEPIVLQWPFVFTAPARN